jgi:hypothetical protein
MTREVMIDLELDPVQAPNENPKPTRSEEPGNMNSNTFVHNFNQAFCFAACLLGLGLWTWAACGIHSYFMTPTYKELRASLERRGQVDGAVFDEMIGLCPDGAKHKITCDKLSESFVKPSARFTASGAEQ